MSWIYPNALPIAISLVAYNSLLTGAMAIFKRKDSLGIIYFIFSVLVFCWGVGISFMLHNDLPDPLAEKWGRFGQMGAVFIAVTWFHFVLVYTQRLKQFKALLILGYVLAAAILPFSLSDYFVAGYRHIVSVDRYPLPGPLYVVFTGFFAVYVSLSFWVLRLGWKTIDSERKRINYQWLCVAQLYGFLAGGLSFLPVYGIPFPQYNLLMMPLWQIMLAYAMVRHRLMDYEERFAEAARKDKLAAIGILAASINHEIKNPLYVVRGLSESFLLNVKEGAYKSSDYIAQKSIEVIEKTMSHVERILDLIRKLSIFSKHEINDACSGEVVDLKTILEQVVSLMRVELQLHKIRLRFHLDESASRVMCDPRHLEEILFNLLLNACQAMKQKGSVIDIRSEQHDGQVRLLIQDDGPGISPESLKRIFDPFYTTKAEGTGLGLYITRQLVEKNGGVISVKSKEGQGTEVSLGLKKA